MLSLYAAAKAGIEAISKSAAKEWAGIPIRVNAVAPGLTETPMLMGPIISAITSAEVQKITEDIPLKRLAQPDGIMLIP